MTDMSSIVSRPVLADASVIFISFATLALSMALFGVPMAASALGISSQMGIQSVLVAFLLMAASIYTLYRVFSGAVMDKSSEPQLIWAEAKGAGGWKGLLAAALAIVLCAVLLMYRGGGAGGGGGY